MATKVVMEALSPTMEEGRLVKWTKAVGDAVKSGETLAEVETDKAVMELVARADGQLLQQAVKEGDTVPVGDVVAYIGAPGETVAASAVASPAAAVPAVVPTDADQRPRQFILCLGCFHDCAQASLRKNRVNGLADVFLTQRTQRFQNFHPDSVRYGPVFFLRPH